MRRLCNIVYAWLAEPLDLEGRDKLDAELEKPFDHEPATAAVAGRSHGTRELMASFNLQRGG